MTKHPRTARAARLAARAGAMAAALFTLALLAVKLRWGGGVTVPDHARGPAVAADRLEVLATLDLPPGNVTSSRGGRIFFNTHPFAVAGRFAPATMFELVAGAPRPYPDLAAQRDMRFVFGMTVDPRERLWLTSPATLDRSKTRLQAYDLATSRRVFDVELPAGVARFGQDLRVTPDGAALVLADTGAFRFTDAALWIVEIGSFRARRVLAGSPCVTPRDVVIQARGEPYRVGYGLLSFQVGVDGIAFSRDGEWLFLAAMSHTRLCRIRTRDLLDTALSEDERARRVEQVGDKPLSDGIETLPDGRVVLTDVEHGALVAAGADGALTTLVRDPRIVWADGVHATASGDLLLTDSAIPAYIDPLLRPPAEARLRGGAPYRLYRVRGPIPSGR